MESLLKLLYILVEIQYIHLIQFIEKPLLEV